MNANKYRKFYVDWWNVPKSTIYAIVTILLVGGVLWGGGWWASRHNWFVDTPPQSIPNDDGTMYTLRPNARMVVKGSTSLFGGKDVGVTVDDGQVDVRTDKLRQDTKNIVEVADSANRVLSNTDAGFNADSQNNGGEISSPSIESAVEISDDRGNRSGFIISLRNTRVLRRY